MSTMTVTIECPSCNAEMEFQGAYGTASDALWRFKCTACPRRRVLSHAQVQHSVEKQTLSRMTFEMQRTTLIARLSKVL